MKTVYRLYRLAVISLIAATAGCASHSDFPTIHELDLNKFAGDWYVIANIPTFIETNAFNAIESYSEPVGNRINTQFTFNEGALDGPLKTYTPTAFVSQQSKGLWGMQFIWPIKAEYRIAYLDPEYQYTIIGRSKLDYVWVMARYPNVSDETYAELIGQVTALGYDTSKIRRIPHNPVDSARNTTTGG
ncbi:MAG: lipocalin family protein [Pseudomonadota bacterium]